MEMSVGKMDIDVWTERLTLDSSCCRAKSTWERERTTAKTS